MYKIIGPMRGALNGMTNACNCVQKSQKTECVTKQQVSNLWRAKTDLNWPRNTPKPHVGFL